MGRAALLLAALAATCSAVPAAESDRRNCEARDVIVAGLAERFGEKLRGYGARNSDGIVEVYSSDRLGTWTILMSKPDGTACIIASGILWQNVPSGDPA